jgi:CheY-like chemotaxis protein/nitrogen-specific signal transduction histidine kinase
MTLTSSSTDPSSSSGEPIASPQEEINALFLANLSHELKTSLSGILGAGELLQATKLNPEQSRLLRLMQGAGVHLMQLLDEVLDHSRLHAQRFPLITGIHEAVALMEKSILWFDPLANAKGLKLYVWMDVPEPCSLEVDALRLTQIFSNLISNAIKFTASGHVLVHAQVRRHTGLRPKPVSNADSHDPEDQLVVKFIDTGSGIAQAHWPLLFVPFSQVGDSRLKGGLGTGLGLSIAHQLTTLMGGQLQVSSVVGEGSVFELSLPLRRQSLQDHQKRSDGADSAQVASAPSARIDSPQGLSLGLWFEDPLLQKALEIQLNALNLPWVVLDPKAINSQALSGIVTDVHGMLDCVPNHAQAQPTILVMKESWSHVASPLEEQRTLLRAPFSREELKSALRQVWRLGEMAVSRLTSDRGHQELKGIHVLVVEDNPTLLLVYQTLLESMGCVCQLAKDGEQALSVVLSSPKIDLVIMDCHLPIMDGFEATQAIRQWERQQSLEKRLPIIALTAGDAPQEQAKSLECGMDDFCAKPVSRAELLAAIQKTCRF